MNITELKGEALERAIKEEIEAEWNGEAQDVETIITFSMMNKTTYNADGTFKEYENC